MTKKAKDFRSVSEVLKRFEKDRDKYVSREFQKYGYDLALELGDMKHKTLYIKLAKETPRAHLEIARNFVKDAYQARSKARLFMWKLKQLKEGKGTQKDGKEKG